ncbi:Major royal jelly protein [Tenacibaculum litopenaei]|uniref:L-dopachrome tautomerase-related protein n=1 Tax=Tenacibaculum litopenaei TaxID=396016 RepID=UPI003893475F
MRITKLYSILTALIVLLVSACNTKDTKKKGIAKKATETPVKVAEVSGQQLTGITVSDGRVFVNFPRWRSNVAMSVAALQPDGRFTPYPDAAWNQWTLESDLSDTAFVAVQSVVAFKGKMFVLDTRNPLFQGVLDAPRVLVFNLATDKLTAIYKLPTEAYHKDSYINDIRVNNSGTRAYITDSGHAGLIVLNLETGTAKRVLDEHSSTSSEQNQLMIDGKAWKNSVHSDGIALDTVSNTLYYHALTGYQLYAIPTEILENGTAEAVEKAVVKVAKTAAPDGMIWYKGNLFYADLEQHRIDQLNLTTKEIRPFTSGAHVRWADTFSIDQGYLYYTNSRIHEAGADVSGLDFSIYKLKLE